MKRLIFSAAVAVVFCAFPFLASAQQIAAPYTFATRYNVAGQVTGTIAPDPDGAGVLGYAATRNTYGTTGTTSGLLIKTEVGQLLSWADETVDPSIWSGFTIYQTRTFEYDSQGRISATRVNGKNLATESLVQYKYDSWDRVDCKAVRMNPAVFGTPNSDACLLGSPGSYGRDRITKFTYDGWDQVLTETHALGTPVEQIYVTNSYFARGYLQYQSDAKGNRTELQYENGRLKKRLYPTANNPSIPNPSDYNQYTFDKNGNVTIERKRNGTTITNTFDANDRLTFKDLSDNTYSGDVSYGYDLRGLTRYSCFGTAATSSCDTSGQGETNVFDGLGNLTSRTSRMFGAARTLTYQYDTEGNRVRVTHPDGVYFTYGRDGLNRMCDIGESALAPACSTTDPNAFLVVHYSGEGGRLDISRAGGLATAITTDNAMRLGSFTQNFIGTANDLTNNFLYNPANQIVSLGQTNTQYNYTEAKNRVGDYGVNGLNQYTQIDGSAVAYDASGNLTADGTGMLYSYDMENRLVSTSGSVGSTLIYDVLGRLSQVAVAGTTTQFHYDGDALIGEYVSGALTRRYVHGDRVDEPLVQYNNANVGASYRRYLYADHLGSVIAQSDGAGAVLVKLAYDPYGIPALSNVDRFGYTGQMWLSELGVNYYKARVYVPKLGRFLQTDPIFYADDFNLYDYTGNDPTNRIDSNGLIASCAPGGDGGSWCDREKAMEMPSFNADGKPFGSSTVNLGSTHVGRMDPIDRGKSTLYEVHVYKRSKAFLKAVSNNGALDKFEVGVIGANGKWLGKHEGKIPGLPANVTAGLKAYVGTYAERSGWVGVGSTANLSGMQLTSTIEGGLQKAGLLGRLFSLSGRGIGVLGSVAAVTSLYSRDVACSNGTAEAMGIAEDLACGL